MSAHVVINFFERDLLNPFLFRVLKKCPFNFLRRPTVETMGKLVSSEALLRADLIKQTIKRKILGFDTLNSKID